MTKRLLTEGTINRFMELAGNNKYARTFLKEEEEKDKKDSESKDEQAPPADDAAPAPEAGAPEAGAPEGDAPAGDIPPAPEGGGELTDTPDVDLEVDEADIPAVETTIKILDSLVAAARGEGAGGADPMAGGAPDPMAGAMAGGAPDPMAGGAPGGMPPEEEQPALAENVHVFTNREIEGMTKESLKRVTKRLVRESLRK